MTYEAQRWMINNSRREKTGAIEPWEIMLRIPISDLIKFAEFGADKQAIEMPSGIYQVRGFYAESMNVDEAQVYLKRIAPNR